MHRPQGRRHEELAAHAAARRRSRGSPCRSPLAEAAADLTTAAAHRPSPSRTAARRATRPPRPCRGPAAVMPSRARSTTAARAAAASAGCSAMAVKAICGSPRSTRSATCSGSAATAERRSCPPACRLRALRDGVEYLRLRAAFDAENDGLRNGAWLVGRLTVLEPNEGAEREGYTERGTDLVITRLDANNQVLFSRAYDSGPFPGLLPYFFSGEQTSEVVGGVDIWPTADGGAIALADASATLSEDGRAVTTRGDLPREDRRRRRAAGGGGVPTRRRPCNPSPPPPRRTGWRGRSLQLRRRHAGDAIRRQHRQRHGSLAAQLRGRRVAVRPAGRRRRPQRHARRRRHRRAHENGPNSAAGATASAAS